ncbi:MAG: AmpE protein [Oceanicoccus sp.]|jgi:AmpE protein
MEFLSLLIVLGLLQLWGSGAPVQRDEWLQQFMQTLSKRVPAGELRLLLIVGLPLLLVLLLLTLISSWVFGLLSLLVCVVVLLYSLGRGDFNQALQSYINAWDHGNYESAYEKAYAIGDFEQSENIVDYQSLHKHARAAILYEGFERWFAVVFWFLVLGPVGALAYRLSYICGRSEQLTAEERQLALRFVHYLDWLPVRLMVFSFALTGNFVSSFNQGGKTLMDNPPVAELLDDCAVAAITGNEDYTAELVDEEHFIKFAKQQLLALQSLLSRSVICWVAVIAVLTLFSG